MNIKRPILKFVVLAVRYFIAVIVAFFSSYFVFFVFLSLGNPPEKIWYLFSLLSFAATGFCGVSAGTFCLPRSNRFLASIILLGLGLLYSLHIIGQTLCDADTLFPLTWLLPLAVGGSGAVLFFWWRSYKILQELKLTTFQTDTTTKMELNKEK